MFPFQPHSPPGGSGKELSRHQEPAIHWGIIPRALPALPWLPGAPTCTGMERERSALFDSGPAPSRQGWLPFDLPSELRRGQGGKGREGKEAAPSVGFPALQVFFRSARERQ